MKQGTIRTTENAMASLKLPLRSQRAKVRW